MRRPGREAGRVLDKRRIRRRGQPHNLQRLDDPSRKKQGLSQEQVAAKLGVPRNRITKIEPFDRRLDVPETLPLTRLYGLHLAGLEAMMK